MGRASAAARLFLLTALVAAAPAQDPAGGPVTWTTPDGARFVLVPDPRSPLVHWATASLVQDPPRFAGLSLAAARAALAGTWSSGGRDGAREAQVLDELDGVYRAWLGDRDAERTAEVARLTTLAQQLGDPAAHARVLATVPMHQPELLDRAPVLVYVTTTVPSALPEVAARMFDRREHSALRTFHQTWFETVVERATRLGGDADAALHAEVLALEMPDHPYLHELELPGQDLPPRELALRTWQATQRPERTVHVLHGAFDTAATKALLDRTFAATTLPPAPPLPNVAARPIASQRRSVVPGARTPTIALAFVLPDGVDPDVLAVAARWLGDGADSHLGQELPRQGRAGTTIACQAPWPPTIGGRSLLLLTASDPDGTAGLLPLVRRTAREAVQTPPRPAALDRAVAAAQREWIATTDEPRRFAAAVAEAALLWPDRPPRTTPVARVDGRAVQQLLARTLATQPVIVEAQR